MTTRELPAQFAELIPLTQAWGQETETERNNARVTSEMEDIQAFYNAVMPHMENILTFLGEYDDTAEAPVRNLAFLAKSFIEASVCVELFHAPTVPDGFDYRRFNIFSPT
ncbi:MAG: hypothetical protein ACI915_005465 [Gammaproteobacteria bacterium]|jgi:hypothetical protein